MIVFAAVCLLGGSIPETPRPAASATPTPAVTATPKASATPSPAATATPKAGATATPASTRPTATPAASASPDPTPIDAPTSFLPDPTPENVALPTPPATPTPPPLVTLATPSATPAPASPDGSLTSKQIGLHKEAAARLTVIVEETFAEMRRGLLANEQVTEAGLVAFIAERLRRDGLVTDRRPVVLAGSNASYPDQLGGSGVGIGRGQIVLVDVMAKKDGPDAVYARTTWVAFTGKKSEIPQRVERVWKMVRDAREAALEKLKKPALYGGDVDLAARLVIRKAKHAPWFQHGAGEPLGGAIAATGVPFKQGEAGKLPENACWALRPAVYYPAEFGIRSEIDVCRVAGGVEVTTGIRQREIRPLLE